MQAFYAWLRRWPALVDGALAAGLGGLSLGMLNLIAPGYTAQFVVFSIALVIPLVLRRRYPVGAFAAVIVIGGLQVPILPRPILSDLAVVVMLYTLAVYRPRRLSASALVVCLLGSAVAIAAWAPAHDVRSVYTLGEIAAVFAGPALIAWLLGDLMHWRRGYYRALEERAARLERERDARAQIAVAAERARIARELHDVVAHNVSVMVVQADGAGYALDSSPERAREALAAISRTGRQALAEMRGLLGVLRSSDSGPGGSEGGAELAPQPSIDQLAGLLEQTRAAGLPVSFTVEGVPRELAAGPALAAYRIVQESLTNARKHGGPATTASVRLRFCEEELVIEVTDDGRGSGSRAGSGSGPGSEEAGHGLLGMRERVETYGGTVTAGDRPGGGWQVRAALPLAPFSLEAP